MEPVTVRFAATADDAVRMRRAQTKLALPRAYRSAAELFGVLFLLLAAAVPVFRLPNRWAAAVAAVCGVFLLFLWQPLLRAAVRRGAQADFAAGRFGPPAQTVRFSPDEVEFAAEGYEGRIPYGMLYFAYEDRSVLLLYLGIGECRAVPLRAMAPEERRRVESLLKDRMKQKFMQEGAREWTK
jgi:hypothetical protein